MRPFIGGIILNYIGAVSRWIYGSIWRTIFNKKKFNFQEYLSEPNNPNYYDEMGHKFSNKIIGTITIGIIIFIISVISEN